MSNLPILDMLALISVISQRSPVEWPPQPAILTGRSCQNPAEAAAASTASFCNIDGLTTHLATTSIYMYLTCVMWLIVELVGTLFLINNWSG